MWGPWELSWLPGYILWLSVVSLSVAISSLALSTPNVFPGCLSGILYLYGLSYTSVTYDIGIVFSYSFDNYESDFGMTSRPRGVTKTSISFHFGWIESCVLHLWNLTVESDYTPKYMYSSKISWKPLAEASSIELSWIIFETLIFFHLVSPYRQNH